MARGFHFSDWRGISLCSAFTAASLCFAACAAVAAEPSPPGWDRLATPFFRHLQIPRDLPSAATDITQDATGFIWIGTQEGLVRWDGYRARLFSHDANDPESLPANVVSAIIVNEQQTIFVTVEEGAVSRYDPETEHFVKLPPAATASGMFTPFISDGKGGLWLGNAAGLSHWTANSKSWERIEFTTHTAVLSLLRDNDGTLWAGTNRGLMRRTQDGTFAEMFAGKDNPFHGVAIKSLLQTKAGMIWFGTNDGRVASLSPDGQVREADIDHPTRAILSLNETRTGAICAGTGGSGILFIDPVTARTIQIVKFDPLRTSGLMENYVARLFSDRSGGLWVGHNRGADYLPATSGVIQSLLPSNRESAGLSGSHVTAIASKSDGKIWISTDNGADILAQGEEGLSIVRQSSDIAPPTGTLTYNSVTSANGDVWFGTDQGVFLNEKAHLHLYEPLGNSPTRSLRLAGDTLWIGSEQGIGRFDLKSHALVSYRHDPLDPQSLSDNFILTLALDPQRGVWVGTSHGLNLFDGQGFTSFFHEPGDPDSLPSDVSATLLLDRHDRIWVGTQGAGIAVLEGDPKGTHRFRHLGRAEGLPSEDVDTLLKDANGRIWASTDAGIVAIDPETLAVESFTSTEGVTVTGHFLNAGTRAVDGTLLFGGLEGITLVHPDRSTAWNYQPAVTPTAIRVGQTQKPLARHLVLPANEHSLQVEFSALDFSAPERNKYSYKLDGFDRDWIQTDADHRLAAYTNLAPGSYTLLLRGTNRTGQWTDPPTRISITVQPAWYQTLLFKIVLAMALLGAVVLVIRSRTALLRRRQQELEGEVAERTAEIASLLHNSGEGFLSLGSDLIVDRQYSLSCETFLGESPAGKNAAALLFSENAQHLAFVMESIPVALLAKDLAKRDLILSLLPKEIDRRGRRLKTHYAMLENGHLMVVLRDITTERRLAERVASEHKRLGMIVNAVSDSRDFFDTISAYREFLARPPLAFCEPETAMNEVYRIVHTFKGEFNLFSFEQTPEALHRLEERLTFLLQQEAGANLAEINAAISHAGLADHLEEDLKIVIKALGNDFLIGGGHIRMPPDQANQIKILAGRWRNGETVNPQEPETLRLLEEIESLGSVSLKQEIERYDQTLAQAALKLDKEVTPLLVSGDESIRVDPDVYGPFLRSLIHVFRNCVTHGIETPDERLESGKNEAGHISCHINQDGQTLRLAISDDGAGIDLPTLRERVVLSGQDTEERLRKIPDSEIIEFIFRDHISTAVLPDHWAGRGVGLSAVRQEVESLGGSIKVKTAPGEGTHFEFHLPLRPRPV